MHFKLLSIPLIKISNMMQWDLDIPRLSQNEMNEYVCSTHILRAKRKTMFIFEIFIFSTQRIFSWIIALSWMFRTELLCFCFEWSWIVKENKQILAPIKCICSCTLTLSTNSLFVERREFVDWWKYMLLSSLMCILYVRLW